MSTQIFNIPSFVQTDLLFYSIVLDVILFVSLGNQKSRESHSTSLFKLLIAATALSTLAEIVSWLSGEVGNTSLIPLHYWSNALYLSCTALPGSLGLYYIDYKIFGTIIRRKRKLFIFLIPTFLNIIMVVYNHFNRGFYFLITDSNQYRRGSSLYSSSYYEYAFMLVVIIYFFSHKNLITGRITRAILVFVFTPFAGAILQMLAYGTTLLMPSYTLALFMTFLILEKDELSRDPLTGLYNRGNMEYWLHSRLKLNEPFSVIMTDLNDFKWINDNLGHVEGDRILQNVSEIFCKSVGYEDMVCRYGGDEFFLLIEHRDDIAGTIIRRIEQHLERYNRTLDNYSVNISFGYVYVSDPALYGLEELISEADRKMYDDKLRRKIRPSRY